MKANPTATKKTMKLDPKLKKERKKVEGWLKANQRFINYNGIEKNIKAPKGLIQKWVKYDKTINDKWIIPIHEQIQEIAKFNLKISMEN